MKLLPQSLSGRVILILFLSLTVSHLASLAIYYGDRVTTLTLFGGGHLAERVVTITSLIDKLPRSDRQDAILAAQGARVNVTNDPSPASWRDDGGDWRTRIFASVLRDHFKPNNITSFRIGYVEEQPGRPSVDGVSLDRTNSNDVRPVVMGVSVQLNDGSWLNFAAPIAGAGLEFSFRVVLSISVMAAAIFLAALWAARRMTAPLTMTARAAQRLARNLDAAPLPTGGPTEVRMAAQALNDMHATIRRFVRDRTRMIAAISHDLATPITRLRLRSEFIQDEEEKRKVLSDLDEMDQMISSVLAFAKDDESEETVQKIDLAATLLRICDDLSDAGESATYDGPNRVPFLCRPIAIRRAFRNLIENAVEYGRTARVSLHTDKMGIHVRIEDEGPGLPDQELEKVFDPFYRVESSRSRETGGAGLGLTVARTIIHAHGGQIRLENRSEGGLRVSVTFPQ